jgi:type I restriction enzyme, S subunit
MSSLKTHSNLDSPEIFGNFATNSKEWKVVKLENILEMITYGLTVRPKYIKQGIPLLSATQIKDHRINLLSAPQISLDDYNNLSDKCKLKNGDVLFSKTGTIGNCAIYNNVEEVAIAQNVARLVFDKTIVDLRYIFHYLRSPFIQNLSHERAKGNAVKDLQLGEMKKFPVPLPPLEEQKRIAAILDKADRVRRKRQEAIRLTEELGRSIFLDMFGDPVTNPKGWKIAKIETIAAKEKNSMAIGPFGSNLKVSDYHESGYPIIFVKDVKENNFKWLSNRYVNDKKFKELSSHQVKPLDVLATKMGTPPCISAVYPKSMPTGVITADLIKISVSTSEAIPSYISIAINSDFCKQQVERITEGITRPKVTLRDFKKILIPIPPLGKQKEWEYKYEQLNLIKQKNRDQLLQLDELFNSLLQRAFRGEL